MAQAVLQVFLDHFVNYYPHAVAAIQPGLLQYAQLNAGYTIGAGALNIIIGLVFGGL